MAIELSELQATVQKNCHIADARHAGDYTLCIYLLKMREYYRWEKGIGFGAALPKQELGTWLQAREELWESLQADPYEPVPVAGQTLDPFDASRINAALIPKGLVYSAGLGRGAKPHFFLARLEHREVGPDYQVVVSAAELARDLSAPPAMTQNRTIFVRRESVRRMVWEKVEEWGWKRPDNPMGRAIASYGFDADKDAALEAMTGDVLQLVLRHEVGEIMAEDALHAPWREMIATLPRSKVEFMARAVRDLLADCLATLPALLDADQAPSLHFYVGHLDGMRKQLFPRLQAAYQAWNIDGDLRPLRALTARGRDHWLQVAEAMLACYREHGEDCLSPMEELLERSAL